MTLKININTILNTTFLLGAMWQTLLKVCSSTTSNQQCISSESHLIRKIDICCTTWRQQKVLQYASIQRGGYFLEATLIPRVSIANIYHLCVLVLVYIPKSVHQTSRLAHHRQGDQLARLKASIGHFDMMERELSTNQSQWCGLHVHACSLQSKQNVHR